LIAAMPFRCAIAGARFALPLLLAALALTAGCGGVDSGRLVDYLDELEFDVPLETASYVSLGKFDIPIAATRQRIGDHASPEEHSLQAAEGGHVATPGPLHVGDAVRMRLQFELMAETAPPYEQDLLALAERHRGAMNDAVLTVVRTSTVEELSDPRLTAVKTRLSEMTRPMLGEDRVRQLVLSELTADEMAHSASHGAKKQDAHGHESQSHDAKSEGKESHEGKEEKDEHH